MIIVFDARPYSLSNLVNISIKNKLKLRYINNIMPF